MLGEVPSAQPKLRSPRAEDGDRTAPLHSDAIGKMRQGAAMRDLTDTALLAGPVPGNYAFRDASEHQVELHTAFSFRGDVRNVGDQTREVTPNRLELDINKTNSFKKAFTPRLATN